MGIYREPDENIAQGVDNDGDPVSVTINPDGSVDSSNVTDREIMIAMLVELQGIRSLLMIMMDGECSNEDHWIDKNLNIRFIN